MRYLGLDLGTRTLGVSVSDETLTIANALKTIHFTDSNYDELLLKLEPIVKEYNVSKFILGFPKNMNNTVGDRGITTLNFKDKLEKKFNIEVVMQDERLTTVEATNYMLAANIILQTYLDKEKGGLYERRDNDF